MSAVGKPVHRRDAEIAEKAQREEMKMVTEKEDKKMMREHSSSSFSAFSLRSRRLCGELVFLSEFAWDHENIDNGETFICILFNYSEESSHVY
jgi:hypothetical protein